MIIIDKRQYAHSIIATLSDTAFNVSNQLVLKFKNTATNHSYSLVLPTNVSPFPSRYYKFEITELPEYAIGTYVYSIVEREASTLHELQILEVGLLKVIGDAETENIVVYRPESDEILVYK